MLTSPCPAILNYFLTAPPKADCILVPLCLTIFSHSPPKGATSPASHLGELSQQGATLQPEVILLAVQLPLKHLCLAQQCLYLLK